MSDHQEMDIRIGVSLRSSFDGIDARTGGRWMVERATAARDARLDSLFVGDHHATGSLYFQNTAVLGRLLAAWNPDVAGALFLLPLWNPVLVAEQIGTLAALTEGRFVMQCGIGAGRAQFAAMGVDVKDRRRLFEHHLAVVRALLAGEEVDGVRIAPVPAEPVDVWIGATAPAAIERAARLGDGWLAAPALTLEQAAGQIDSYRAACDGLGRPVGAAVIRQDVHVGASSSDARAATDEIIARGYRGFDPAALAVGSIAEVTDRFGRLAAMGYDEVSVRHLVDDQAQVLASLERLGEVRAQLDRARLTSRRARRPRPRRSSAAYGPPKGTRVRSSSVIRRVLAQHVEHEGAAVYGHDGHSRSTALTTLSASTAGSSLVSRPARA